MSIAIDIIIAVVCVTAAIKAYKAGLVKSVMRLVKGIASFIAAYAFSPTFGDWICDNIVLGRVSDGIRKTIESLSRTESGSFNLSKMFGEMPDSLLQIIERYKVDKGALGGMCENVTDASAEAVDKLSVYIAEPISHSLSNAAAFVLIFIGAFLALSIATYIVDAVFHLPVLNGVNKFLGLVFGVAEALLFAVLLSSAAAAIVTALGSYDSNLFGEHVVNNSIIMKLFSSVDLFGLIDISVK